MSDFEARFAPFAERMAAEELPQLFIDTFAQQYRRLVQGDTGLISEADIEPVETLPAMTDWPAELAEVGERLLGRTAVIRLNGGLGTSMGLEQAKSLLPVRQGLTFLDIIARQAQHAGVQLVLMNSFATEPDSLARLADYPQVMSGLSPSFLQHKAPKVRQDNYQPVTWPPDPELEWCPPGHGDLYTALVTRGTLAALLTAGYRYAFVSNADNLGAVVDPILLGYFARHQLPFMMEVARRTAMDRKGGHLAQNRNGRLLLRESAQCPEADREAFQDIQRHRYFNTNNLWLNLPALQDRLAAADNRLALPLIRNAKTVDPRDPDSVPVYQLETAMGTAVSLFPDAQAVLVPRSRFAPVKTSDDLLAVRSDAYTVTEAHHVVPHPRRRHKQLHIELDGAFYRFVTDLDHRFPAGPPSLRDCDRFELQGDFRFGRDVVARGAVRLVNATRRQVRIPDGTVLEGELRFTSEDDSLPAAHA